MPVTYNGIGTRYFGRKNITQRPGPCPHCHRALELTSYDTRLWFVVLFIPIIPLTRKRIIDYCRGCTRHYAVDIHKWETAKQLEISGAQEEYRKNPTPEGAIALHAQLLKFHQATQAAEFQKVLSETYATNAKVQAYLASALEHFGRLEESADYYERALKLRADLPEARVGVARARLRSGQLDEARKLLDFLEKSGAGQLYSLHPLEVLAIAYQKAGRHNEALDLFSRLQAELPKIAEVKQFRDMVKKSEKALQRQSSILPKQKFSLRRFFSQSGQLPEFAGGTSISGKRALILLGVAVALVFLGMVIANEFIRRHRTVFVVNGFPQTIDVKINGVSDIRRLRSVQQLELKEGKYHATINGAVHEEFDFEITSSYFDRWFGDPVWVLNPGGAATLLLEHVSYGRNPPPATYSFHVGRSFEFFPQVPYPFKDLPDSLQMHANETRVLNHLDVYHGQGQGVFQEFVRDGKINDALTFAENHLRTHPGDHGLVQGYTDLAVRENQMERFANFLKSNLTNRPVAIDLHRAYQHLHENHRELPQLIAEYDALLKAEPTNSALLYLRGRIDPDRSASRRLFQEAAAADPKNPFPAYALGYDRMVTGDWPEARNELAQAVKLAPNDDTFRHTLFVARLALGEASALESEARTELRSEPFKFSAELHLIFALGKQERKKDILAESSDFQRRLLNKAGIRGRTAGEIIQRFALYAAGEFAEREKASASDKTAAGKRALSEALIEQGRVKEVFMQPPSDTPADERPFWLLTLSAAYHNSGDLKTASDLRARAAKLMSEGQEDMAHAATFLTRPLLPSARDIEDIVLPPGAKAIFMTALAQANPERAKDLLAAANRFNVEPQFPYYLIQRIASGSQSVAEKP